MEDTKLLIGWYDTGSKRFCYTDVKDTFRKESYTVPVYAHLSDDVKQLKERIKELEELLTEYGRHQPGCPAQSNVTNKKYPCRCGWDKEKKELKGE